MDEQNQGAKGEGPGSARAGDESGLAILRDHLAVDRTVLANERTWLAYVRTALTLFVAGVTFIRFFDQWLVEIIGILFLPLSILFLVLGVRSYRRMKAILKHSH